MGDLHPVGKSAPRRSSYLAWAKSPTIEGSREKKFSFRKVGGSPAFHGKERGGRGYRRWKKKNELQVL